MRLFRCGLSQIVFCGKSWAICERAEHEKHYNRKWAMINRMVALSRAIAYSPYKTCHSEVPRGIPLLFGDGSEISPRGLVEATVIKVKSKKRIPLKCLPSRAISDDGIQNG